MAPGVKRTKNDIFRDVYLGEYVQIVVTSEADGIITEGYVLEVDDYEIYLGETAGAVTHAVPRHGYKLICVTTPKGEFDTIMDSLNPPKAEEIN